MDMLRRLATVVRETTLFTTLALALRDPHSAVWIDAEPVTPRCRGWEGGGLKGEDKG